MKIGSVIDPLFLIPFINGLVLAVLLPALGAYIRLRDEWLASLGVAQAAAAGVVIGALFLQPVAVIALLAAGMAATAKAVFGRAGNDNYALMILAGWSAALLAAANSAHGNELSRMLTEGQLYFTGLAHLKGIGVLFIAFAALMPRLSPRLLLGRLFPDHFRANGNGKLRHDLVFDLLVALTLALASTAIGVMAAFALVFIPAWVAFRFAGGWRRVLAWCVALSVCAYLTAFVAAIVLDQPFGPVLVASCILMCLVRVLARA